MPGCSGRCLLNQEFQGGGLAVSGDKTLTDDNPFPIPRQVTVISVYTYHTERSFPELFHDSESVPGKLDHFRILWGRAFGNFDWRQLPRREMLLTSFRLQRVNNSRPLDMDLTRSTCCGT